jgi:hypothetical protein
MLYNQLINYSKYKVGIIDNGVGARGKKLSISDTSYSSLIRGPVESTEGGEERKELVLEDLAWNCWNLVLMRSDMKGIFQVSMDSMV